MGRLFSALRLDKDGSTKTARIMVPIFLEAGEDPNDMVASASFRPLVAVLQGLRSHDERLVEQLASRALTRGQRKVHVQRDADGGIVGTGGEGQERDDTTAAAAASRPASSRTAARPRAVTWK